MIQLSKELATIALAVIFLLSFLQPFGIDQMSSNRMLLIMGGTLLAVVSSAVSFAIVKKLFHHDWHDTKGLLIMHAVNIPLLSALTLTLVSWFTWDSFTKAWYCTAGEGQPCRTGLFLSPAVSFISNLCRKPRGLSRSSISSRILNLIPCLFICKGARLQSSGSFACFLFREAHGFRLHFFRLLRQFREYELVAVEVFHDEVAILVFEFKRSAGCSLENEGLTVKGVTESGGVAEFIDRTGSVLLEFEH